jgi:hypothetical protein
MVNLKGELMGELYRKKGLIVKIGISCFRSDQLEAPE